MFTVNVAADVYGQKQNIRLEFPACPTMTELITTVEDHMDVKSRATRPIDYPDIPFKVQTIQIYDDVLLRWVDLYSTTQPSFVSGCQVYGFQPETFWTQDAQDRIPPAERTFTWSSNLGSPSRLRAISDYGVTPAASVKIRSVFNTLALGKDYVTYSDLMGAFRRYDLEFSARTVGQLFDNADRNLDGRIVYTEWIDFSMQYPNIVDALYFRSRDLGEGRYVGPTTTELELERIRARESEITRIYEESNWRNERERLQADYEGAKAAAAQARAVGDAAAAEERAAFSKLIYQPTSPRRFVR
mgnify:CR=1 FL=1